MSVALFDRCVLSSVLKLDQVQLCRVCRLIAYLNFKSRVPHSCDAGHRCYARHGLELATQVPRHGVEVPGEQGVLPILLPASAMKSSLGTETILHCTNMLMVVTVCAALAGSRQFGLPAFSRRKHFTPFGQARPLRGVPRQQQGPDQHLESSG